MSFKTTDKNGLILYNAGTQSNFFAIELVNGVLHVSANDGSGTQVSVFLFVCLINSLFLHKHTKY